MATISGGFAMGVDVSEVVALAGALGEMDTALLARSRVEAVNDAIDSAYEKGRRRMIDGINLDDSYLRRKMTVTKATERTPRASLSASAQGTVLGRFDAKPKVVATKTPAARLLGNRGLGLPPGQKQQGVNVTVTRGSEKSIDGGFLLPLRRGTEAAGNGYGVFTRGSDGKLRHRYGPAPYQLFRAQIDQLGDEAQDEMANEVLVSIDKGIQKVLPK